MAYQVVLDEVRQRLVGLGLEATTRVKTIGTLIDKLRREQRMELSRLQDLAGARIVIDGGREDQDRVTELIVAAFRDAPKTPKVVDRRTDPRYGYRAVHVIAFPDGVPVEIQVRTQFQDSWAQIVESLGDRWGRAIRYGGQPDDPYKTAIAMDGGALTRAAVWARLQVLSEMIATLEESRRSLDRNHQMLRQIEAAARHPDRWSEEDWEDVQHTLHTFEKLLRRGIREIFSDRRRAGREYRRIFGRRGGWVRRRSDVERYRRLLRVVATQGRQAESLLQSNEATVRATLQLLERAADHGE